MVARKNTSLENLRQVALARQKAANRKVSRLKSKGIKVAGTKHDVRRPAENISRYNANQLANYIGRLNDFVDRKTSFVSDVHGRPISGKVWREYKKLENQHNKIVNDAFGKVKDIPVPISPAAKASGGTPQTIEERQAGITPKHKHVGNVTNSPYEPVVRQSKNFVNEQKLRQMTAKLKKKLSGDFLAKDLKTDRRVVRKMTEVINRPDINKRIKKLSDEQFNILWNFWGFAKALASPYELVQAGFNGKDKAWFQKNIEENLKEGLRLLGDAETLKLGS